MKFRRWLGCVIAGGPANAEAVRIDDLMFMRELDVVRAHIHEIHNIYRIKFSEMRLENINFPALSEMRDLLTERCNYIRERRNEPTIAFICSDRYHGPEM